MIFYGSRSSNLKNGRIRSIACPNCNTNTDMNYSVYGKYAHIYWIPFVPIGRVNIVECNSCHATYDVSKLDKNTRDKFSREQSLNPTKTPWNHYIGLFLIGLGVIFAIIMGIKSNNDTLDYAKNPKVGDIFYEKTESGNYSTSKVTKVTKDSVYVMQNNMETDKESSVDEIAGKPENYTMPYGYTKKQLIALAKKDNEIYEIKRP